MSSPDHRREEEGFRLSEVLHQACFRPSFQVRSAQLRGAVLMGMHPKQSKQGCPSSPESSIKAKDIAGLSGENFTAYQEKGVVLVFEISCVAGQRKEDSIGTPRAWERRKSEHPRGTAMSRGTAETRAVVMTYICALSPFGLTASKKP